MLQNPSSSPTNKLPPEDVLKLPPKQLELSRKENGPAGALKFSRNAESLVKYTLPEVGERIASTPQLVYCLSLLHPSLVSKEGLSANELDWSQARSDDPDEQNRLQTMATDLIKAFVRDELKKPGVVAEVVSLAAVLDQDDFKKLLQIFVDGIDQTVFLNAHLLDGLAQLIRNATQEYIDPDDLVIILELLNKRLKDTHDQSTQNKYRLAMAISAVLDSMVDTQVEDLSREQIHEPLSDYLKQLQESSDSYLVYQAVYAYQALQHIADDETFLRAAIRRTGKVIQGVSGVMSAVKAIDVAGFIDGLQGIQQSLTGAGKSIALAMDTYANVKALAESGQELLESLKEGSSFTRKSAWYPALRGLDRFLQEGRFLEFEKLVREAPCRHDLTFQWGVCQRLGEIAVGTFWDTDIRKSAVSFLGELYEDDATWGQHRGIKSWILKILSQLVDLSEGVIADETQTLLRLLETNGSAEKRQLYQSCKKDQPGPFMWMAVLPQQESLLLDCVQNKPDVETPLRQLRRERLKGRDEDVYVSPRAKPSLRSTEDFDLTSKVQEFLDGNKKVLLILGDSGAGKSTFNRALEINLWDKYNTIDGQIPLFIHLPTIDKPEHDLITKYLRKVDFTETQIRELKLYREFILICDGYDESQQTRNLYTSNQLNQAEGWRARMVISCRTEYINIDYKDCFQPVDTNGTGIRDLLQEAVIAPFNKNQIQDYVGQYLMLKKSPWESKNFLKAFKQIPNLQDLVKNPFLLKLALEVLPELLDTDSVFSSAHITRVGLYDEFIGQWIDRNKIRLGEIELNSYDKEALKVLLDSGFKQCGVMYFKELAAAIYANQDGNPVINYTPHRDRRTWKEELFNNDSGRNLLREAIPLTRNGDQFRFIHKSVLEYGLTLAVFDPSEHIEDREPVMDTSRRGSTSSVLSFEVPVSAEKSTLTTEQSLVDSPLGRRNLVGEESILRFFVDRARDQPVFKDQLLSTIERSKTDKSARIAAANSITILVRAGVQFNGVDLRDIKIPGADLSFGVFDSAQLRDADLRKVNFRNVWLREADLSGAQMTGAQFGELPFLEESCMVNSGAFSPDGEKYAVGLVIGSINLYETSSWSRVQSLKGHNQGISCIVFSQTGDQIASGGWDGTVRLWNVETGDCVYTLQGHSGNVTSIMYSPKGDHIISGSHDSTVRLWDVGTGDCIHTLQGHSHYVTRATYSPKGDRIASGSWDSTVCLWDVATGGCIHVLRGHSNQVDSIAYSPKGDRIASGGSDLTVRLWDAETGDCIHILEGHSGRVTCITYSPKGDRIASGSCDKTVRLWDAETGNCIHTMQKHSDQVKTIVYSPKGDQIASGSEDHTIRLWDVDTGDCLQTLQGHVSQIANIAYSPKGDIVVSGSVDKTVRLWNVGTGDCTPTFQAHSAKVNSVVYSPSGCQVASGSWDNTVRLWDVESGNCTSTLQCYDGEAKSVDKLVYVTCVLYSPKGDRIASKCDDQTIRLWDVDTSDCIHIFRGHSDDIWSVAYSPTGTQVASGSWDWTVRLWDTDTGGCVHTLRGHGHNVVCVVYSPKGDRVASASWDSTVRLWDVDTGNCLHVLKGHTNDVHAVAYSPKGDQIASVSSDMTVRLWNTETGDCAHTLKGHDHGVRVVAYSPNGGQVASGSPDRSVRLWDVDAGACIHILKSHKGYVDSIAYSPKGEYIASGSRDKTVRLWDVASGQCLVTISDFNGGVGSVALDISLGDLYLVTGSDDGSVRRWKITDEHKALLHWSSSHAELTVSGASFGDCHGLSQPNVGLLNQRRALVTSTPSSM